jgi:hypothetical protein
MSTIPASLTARTLCSGVLPCVKVKLILGYKLYDIQQGTGMKRLGSRGRQERPGSDSSWVKSSLSFSNGNCVEVANLPNDEIGIRDSKNTEGPDPVVFR